LRREGVMKGHKRLKDPREKYPWDKWFSKRIFRLVRGVDYSCQPHAMATMIRTKAANTFGVRVSVLTNEGTLTVEVLRE
jgi:hypothetical protein